MLLRLLPKMLLWQQLQRRLLLQWRMLLQRRRLKNLRRRRLWLLYRSVNEWPDKDACAGSMFCARRSVRQRLESVARFFEEAVLGLKCLDGSARFLHQKASFF